jgi:hypothetical protein
VRRVLHQYGNAIIVIGLGAQGTVFSVNMALPMDF